MKKWRSFVNTIAAWSMPVRQSYHNLQRCSEKWKVPQKKLFHNWQLIPNFLIPQKTSAPLSLMTTYWMSPISAGSTSLDSTFNKICCSTIDNPIVKLGIACSKGVTFSGCLTSPASAVLEAVNEGLEAAGPGLQLANVDTAHEDIQVSSSSLCSFKERLASVGCWTRTPTCQRWHSPGGHPGKQ